jgi:transcriptional regulator GlxA family with amidase domain
MAISPAADGQSSVHGPQAGPPERIAVALHFIEAHYAERLTGVTLAQVAGLERSHFMKLFRSSTGRTPHAYITHRRIQRACELLREGLKVEAVSLAAGFPARGTFYRAFRAATAMTPAVYRSAHAIIDQKAHPTEQDTNTIAP